MATVTTNTKPIVSFVDPAEIAAAFRMATDPLLFEPDMGDGSIPTPNVAAHFAEHGTAPAQQQAGNAIWRMDIDCPTRSVLTSLGNGKPIQIDELFKGVDAHRHVDMIKKIAVKKAIRVDMLAFLEKFEAEHPKFDFGSFAWSKEVRAARAARYIIKKTVNWANDHQLASAQFTNDPEGYERASRFIHFLITMSIAEPWRIKKEVVAEWAEADVTTQLMGSLSRRTNDGYPLNKIKSEWVWRLMRGSLFSSGDPFAPVETYKELFGTEHFAGIERTLWAWDQKNMLIASVARTSGSCLTMYRHLFNTAHAYGSAISEAVHTLTWAAIQHRQNIRSCPDAEVKRVFVDIGEDSAGSMAQFLRMLVLILNNDGNIWAQDNKIDENDLKVFHRILTERDKMALFVKMAESLSFGRRSHEDIARSARDNIISFVSGMKSAFDETVPVSILRFFGREVPVKKRATPTRHDTPPPASKADVDALNERLFFGIGATFKKLLAKTMTPFERREVGVNEFRIVRRTHSEVRLRERNTVPPQVFSDIELAVRAIQRILSNTEKHVVYIKVVDGKIEVRS